MDDEDYGGGRPLSNADFRRMLAMPRPGRQAEEGREERIKKPQRPKPQKPQKAKPAGEGGEEEPGYRDRAAERRKGIVSDFDAIPEDLANIIQGGEGGLSKLSYEESKFLGGDIAHTHLVKGLDFALLQKIRAEQQKAGKAGEESEEEEEQQPVQQQQRQELKFATPLGRAVHAFFFDPKQRASRAGVAEMFLPRRTAWVFELGDPAGPDVPTMLRRSKEDCPKVQEMMLGAMDSNVLERIGKLMNYMSLAGGKKKLKKKEKMQLLHGIQPARPAVGVDAANGAAAAPGPASLAAAAGWREGGGGLAAPAPAGAAEEEDDIFAGAGTDYVVERRKGGEAGGAAPSAGGRYFDRPEDMSDLPPLPPDGPAPPPPPPLPAGDDMELEELGPPPPPPDEGEAGPSRPPVGMDYSAAYPEADAVGAYPDTDAAYAAATAVAQEAAVTAPQPPPAAAVLRKREDAARLRAAEADADDAYAECYPSYFTYAGTVVDSDDEEGDKRGDQEVGLSRQDFNTEEEYREYLTANPKRAVAAGGPKRKEQREAAKRDNRQAQKLNTQLDKIRTLMEEKGYDHANAFQEAAKGKAGGGFGGVSEEPAMPAKKRRI